MDDIANANQAKWDELARSGILYSRPLLDLTAETAREWLDPSGRLGDVTGKAVLCLAGGGGKQSAAFGCLGAKVSVLDLSAEMLARDHLAAGQYGYPVDARQGDMRDLSGYAAGSFEIVFQPYSINYVPDPLPVFAGVARVLSPGGIYVLELGNPFTLGLFEQDWDGRGYPLHLAYLNGAEIPGPTWTFEDERGMEIKMPGPRTFRHTLSGVLNPLREHGLRLEWIAEEAGSEEDLAAGPATWDHYKSIAPPWMTLWFRKG